MMTINLITVGFGAGLLSLPWGVAGSSVILAMGINAFVLGLNAWTLILLVKAAHKYQRFDLGNLIERIPFRRTGIAVKYLINFLVMIVNVMALIGYEIIVKPIAVRRLHRFNFGSRVKGAEQLL